MENGVTSFDQILPLDGDQHPCALQPSKNDNAWLADRLRSLQDALSNQQKQHASHIEDILALQEQRLVEAIALHVGRMKTAKIGGTVSKTISNDIGKSGSMESASGFNPQASCNGSYNVASYRTEGSRPTGRQFKMVEQLRMLDAGGMFKHASHRDYRMSASSNCATKVIRHQVFEAMSASVIVGNAMMVGAEASWRMANLGKGLPILFSIVDWLCNAAFTIELVLRCWAERSFFISMYNRQFAWNVFDLFIVASSYTTEIIHLTTSSTMDLSVLRLFRILRLVRVFRLLRVLRFFSVLRTMIGGVAASAKLLMWALFLLGIIMYLFGVCILQFLCEEMGPNHDLNPTVYSDLQRWFGSLPRVFYTLFLAICGGMSWVEAAEPLLAISPFMCLLFCTYIAFVVFCVLNIVTGIFVENANKLIANDEERMVMEEGEKRKTWMKEVQTIFAESDADQSGEITFAEFNDMMQDVRIQAYLHKLGVDWEMYSPQALFSQVDFDGNGTINRPEFFLAMQNLHGPARSLDVNHLKHDLKSTIKKVDNLEQNMNRLLAQPIS